MNVCVPSPQLCADSNLTNMQRQLALEVIVTLSETAAAMLRKHTAIVAQSGEDGVHQLDEMTELSGFLVANGICRLSAPDVDYDGGPGGR